MTDSDRIKLFKKTIKELEKMVGKESCGDIEINCVNCQTHIGISLLRDWIDVIKK